MRFCDDPVIHRNTGMAYMLCDPGRVWWDPLRNTWEEKPGKKQEDHASVWAWDLQVGFKKCRVKKKIWNAETSIRVRVSQK